MFQHKTPVTCNPYLHSGLFRPYLMDESISSYRGSVVVFIFTLCKFLEANSVPKKVRLTNMG